MLLAEAGPNVTDWMQGWGSILSLPLSLGALIFTGLLLRHELHARREERHLAMSAQASLVSIDDVALVVRDDAYEVRYRLANLSEKPILGARLEMYMEGDRQPELDSAFAKLVEPAKSVDLVAYIPRESFELLRFSAVLVFRDAAGRAWQKSGDSPPEVCPQDLKEDGLWRLLLRWYLKKPLFALWLRLYDVPSLKLYRIKARLRKKLWDYEFGDHSVPRIGEDVDVMHEKVVNWRKR